MTDGGQRDVRLALTPQDVESVWTDLKWHLEVTADLPSVVFLLVDDVMKERELRDRTHFLAQTNGWPFHGYSSRGFRLWAWKNLPHGGIVWLSSLGSAQDTDLALRTLNELRGRLHSPQAGCLIMTIFSRELSTVFGSAPDLWAVRSFARRIGDIPMQDSPLERQPAQDSSPMVATTPLLFIPEELRSDGTVQLLRSLERVYSFASRDAAQAQHELDQLEKDEDDPLRSFLIWLAAAFIAGKGNDTGGLHGALDHVGASLGKMSASPFSVRACDSARLVAVQFSDYKDEKHLSELMLSQARVLYARLGTPEAARDLAVSLQNLARVYVQTGEVELAQEYLQRAVDKLAEVDKLLNTSESQVELERAIMMCQQAHVQKS